MTALTEAHLKKLTDEDLRSIALRVLTDAVSALDPSIEEHGLTNHPDLDPTPVHEAAEWLRGPLTHPDDGYDRDTWRRHRDAVCVFKDAARAVGKATTAGNGRAFPPRVNAANVRMIFNSVAYGDGTPHRPSAGWLHVALDECGDGFIPGHETTDGYILNTICGSDDPRLPALAETYMQSGLHTTLLDAIDEATKQLALLDELTELNR